MLNKFVHSLLKKQIRKEKEYMLGIKKRRKISLKTYLFILMLKVNKLLHILKFFIIAILSAAQSIKDLLHLY